MVSVPSYGATVVHSAFLYLQLMLNWFSKNIQQNKGIICNKMEYVPQDKSFWKTQMFPHLKQRIVCSNCTTVVPSCGFHLPSILGPILFLVFAAIFFTFNVSAWQSKIRGSHYDANTNFQTHKLIITVLALIAKKHQAKMLQNLTNLLEKTFQNMMEMMLIFWQCWTTAMAMYFCLNAQALKNIAASPSTNRTVRGHVTPVIGFPQWLPLGSRAFL